MGKVLLAKALVCIVTRHKLQNGHRLWGGGLLHFLSLQCFLALHKLFEHLPDPECQPKLEKKEKV